MVKKVTSHSPRPTRGLSAAGKPQLEEEHPQAHLATDEFEKTPEDPEGRELQRFQQVARQMENGNATDFTLETIIGISINGLHKHYGGNPRILVPALNRWLEQAGLPTTNLAIRDYPARQAAVPIHGQTFPLHKWLNGPNCIWRMDVTEKDRLAEAFGWVLSEEVSRFTSQTTIAISTDGLRQHYAGDKKVLVTVLKQWLEQAGLPTTNLAIRDYPARQAAVPIHGQTFLLHKWLNDNHWIWRIDVTERDRLADALGWVLSEEVSRFTSQTTIAISADSLRQHYAGDEKVLVTVLKQWLEQAGLPTTNLAIRNYPHRQAAVPIHGQTFLLHKWLNGPNWIWRMDLAERDRLGQAMQWTPRTSDFLPVPSSEIPITPEGLARIFQNPETAYKKIVRLSSPSTQTSDRGESKS